MTGRRPVAPIPEHLGYLFARERLLGTSLRVPTLINAIKFLAREFVTRGRFDFLGDEIAQRIFVLAILICGCDYAFGRPQLALGLPRECALNRPV